MWLLLPTGGLKSNWLVRKTSFIKEPATFSHETCEQCFINPEFFSSASCIQHTGKTASPSRVFTWTSVIYLFFCGGVMSFVIYICSWGWFQKCLSHKLSHLCVHPIVNWSEMKQQLFCVKFMIKYIPRPKKNHQPVPDKMEYASVATVTRCRRSPMEKHQLQMATNTDLNPGRLLPAVKDGTEFSAGPKNGSY